MQEQAHAVQSEVAPAARPWDHLVYASFLFVLMLAPQRYLQVYYVVVAVLLIGFSLNRVPSFVNRLSIPFLVLTAFVLFGALVRSIAFGGGNPRDYLEAARFLPLILVFASPFRWQRLRIEALIDAALAYLAIDIALSFLQIGGLNPAGIVSHVERFYSSTTHLQTALGISGRALGLSPGPGQHGAVLFVITTVMLYGLLSLPHRKMRCLLGFLVGLIAVLLAQSQTAFVVTVAVTFGLLGLFVIRGDRRGRRVAGLLLAAFAVSSTYVVAVIATRFRYLFLLFIYGLGRSSYHRRQDRWADILGRAFEHPGWLPLGWGKDYFGSISGAMDSDLLYIFSVYGAVVFAIFLIVVLGFLWSTLRNVILRGSLTDHRVLLFCLLLGGLVFSWPNAYFTAPNILLILAIVHGTWWWGQRPAGVPIESLTAEAGEPGVRPGGAPTGSSVAP